MEYTLLNVGCLQSDNIFILFIPEVVIKVKFRINEFNGNNANILMLSTKQMASNGPNYISIVWFPARLYIPWATGDI